jgi:hypothetical protein
MKVSIKPGNDYYAIEFDSLAEFQSKIAILLEKLMS